MQRFLTLLLPALLICGCVSNGLGYSASNSSKKSIANPEPSHSFTMKLTSIFEEGDVIPSRYTCDGKDMSPPLSISDVPDDTQSLVLIVDDPDVPSGAWVHWVVVDISPGVREIAENTSPGVDLTNSFKRTKYGGPCPPSGVHRYFFKLYALDKKLTLSSTSTKTDVEVAMQGHIMAQAGLMGRYQRS